MVPYMYLTDGVVLYPHAQLWSRHHPPITTHHFHHRTMPISMSVLFQVVGDAESCNTSTGRCTLITWLRRQVGV